MLFSGPAFPEFEPAPANDPNVITVFGYVRAAGESAGLASALVYLRRDNSLGQIADSDGRYQLDIPASMADTIVFSQLGFQEEFLAVPVDSGRARIDAELVEFFLCI